MKKITLFLIAGLVAMIAQAGVINNDKVVNLKATNGTTACDNLTYQLCV